MLLGVFGYGGSVAKVVWSPLLLRVLLVVEARGITR